MDVSYQFCPHGVRREYRYRCRLCHPQDRWIRQWFMRKDDFTLWAYGVILVIVSIKAALWFLNLLAALIIVIAD